MSDQIIIYYSPFSQSSSVYVVNATGQYSQYAVNSEFNELAESAVSLAHDLDVQHIKVSAPLAIYSELELLMHDYARTQYNENNLNIEVI